MIAIKKKILVGVKPGELEFYAQRPLVAGDAAAYEIVLTAPYDLDGAVFAVSAKRADGVVVSDMGSITTENGKTAAVYTLKNNIYAVAGMLEIDLQLCKDGGVLTECRLLCDVCEGHTAADVAGDDRLPILTELISRVSLSADAAQNAAEAAANASAMVASALSGVSAATASALSAAYSATIAAQKAEDSAGITVICTGSNDNIKIQAAIDNAPVNVKTKICIKGVARMSQTIGVAGTYYYYLRVPQGKEIVLDFSGCKSVAVDVSQQPLDNSKTYIVFYQEGSLEAADLNVYALAGANGQEFAGAVGLVYNPPTSPADITLRNCRYTTASGAIDKWPNHYGIVTFGNAYLYDSEMSLTPSIYGGFLTLSGTGKKGVADNCVFKSTALYNPHLAVVGTNNVFHMHNCKVKTPFMYGQDPITTNASGFLFAEGCGVAGGNDEGGGAIMIYNGEVKNCSIDGLGSSAVAVRSGGIRGGVVIANNTFYSNSGINNQAGTNTFASNNFSTLKAYQIF